MPPAPRCAPHRLPACRRLVMACERAMFAILASKRNENQHLSGSTVQVQQSHASPESCFCGDRLQRLQLLVQLFACIKNIVLGARLPHPEMCHPCRLLGALLHTSREKPACEQHVIALNAPIPVPMRLLRTSRCPHASRNDFYLRPALPRPSWPCRAAWRRRRPAAASASAA